MLWWSLVVVASMCSSDGSALFEEPAEVQAARSFWGSVNLGFAFLDQTDGVSLLQNWQSQFLGRYEWQNRRVVDYGAASAVLGEWLLKEAGVRHYTAVDITARALEAARMRLSDGSRYVDRFDTVLAPVELCTLGSATRSAEGRGADILVSTKTLQHFPSIAAIGSFLRNVRHSGIEQVMLQVVTGDTSECYGTVEDYARDGSGPVRCSSNTTQLTCLIC